MSVCLSFHSLTSVLSLGRLAAAPKLRQNGASPEAPIGSREGILVPGERIAYLVALLQSSRSARSRNRGRGSAFFPLARLHSSTVPDSPSPSPFSHSSPVRSAGSTPIPPRPAPGGGCSLRSCPGCCATRWRRPFLRRGRPRRRAYEKRTGVVGLLCRRIETAGAPRRQVRTRQTSRRLPPSFPLSLRHTGLLLGVRKITRARSG